MAVELLGRSEQRLAGDDVDVQAGFLVVPELVVERRLGAALLGDVVLLPGQAGYPLRALLVVVRHAGHSFRSRSRSRLLADRPSPPSGPAHDWAISAEPHIPDRRAPGRHVSDDCEVQRRHVAQVGYSGIRASGPDGRHPKRQDRRDSERRQGASLVSTRVPAAAKNPATPWATLIRTPSTWAGAVPRSWRIDSWMANMPYMPVWV